LFWREGVDGQKITFTFLRSIFIPTHHFFFVFSLSLFQRIWSENTVGGGWGVNLVNSLPKVHSKVRYYHHKKPVVGWSGRGFCCLQRNNQHLKVEGRTSRVQQQQAEADWGRKGQGLKARVGSTGGREVTMVATRLCHR
jgi:hypothetical protein